MRGFGGFWLGCWEGEGGWLGLWVVLLGFWVGLLVLVRPLLVV